METLRIGPGVPIPHRAGIGEAFARGLLLGFIVIATAVDLVAVAAAVGSLVI